MVIPKKVLGFLYLPFYLGRFLGNSIGGGVLLGPNYHIAYAQKQIGNIFTSGGVINN